MPIRPHPENDFVKFTCQLERELAETKRLLAEAQKVISGMYFGCNPNGELLTRIDAAIKEQK
jgi:predicted ester cyclase